MTRSSDGTIHCRRTVFRVSSHSLAAFERIEQNQDSERYMTTPSRSFTSAQAPAEFEALIQDIRPELHRYCARMIGSVVDAEDLVQEALAKAYAALPSTSVANMRAWLFRIAHNKAIDYL